MSTEHDTIDAKPTKDIYSAIKADVDVRASVQELTDNILDNARRCNRDNVTASIRCQSDSEGARTLQIKDNSGGVKREELSMLLALGESEKEDIEGSIGAFGIGSKKSLQALGDGVTIRSRHDDADVGYEFTAPPEWFDNDDTWELPVQEVDLEPGTTEIEVFDLNFDWQDVRDGLAANLARTYALYLRGEAPVTLELRFPDDNGTDLEPLTAPPTVAYGYPRWDGLYPRRYEGIVLDHHELDTPVEMNVEVGLITDPENATPGVTWVCQHRVVEAGNQDGTSGFGNVLNKFKLASHKRLAVRVELHTPGDAAELPWNSDKSRIHERHPVTEEARDILSRVVPRYMRAASYGNEGVDLTFIDTYPSDSRHAANGGDIATVDLRDHFRRYHHGDVENYQINDKPDKGFPEVSKMIETVEAHAHLGVKYEDLPWIEPWMRPVYHALLEDRREEFGCFDELEDIDRSPPDFTKDGRDGKAERARLAEIAQASVNQGVRYTDAAEWEQPRYQHELEQAASDRNLKVKSLEPTDEVPEIQDDAESDDEEETEERRHLSFGEFSEEEIEVISSQLGEIEEFSPERRRQALIDHCRRVTQAGIRFDVSAD